MSTHDKLVERFCRVPAPRDFRFSDLETLLNRFGFQRQETSGGSSHLSFIGTCVNDEPRIIHSHRPHPDGILKSYQIKEIKQFLKEWGLI